MLKNYLKIALRNILRYKVYSFINLAGLSVGFVCFILILLYIRYEFSFDAQHPLRDHVYRVNVTQQHPNREFTTYASMAPLGPTLNNDLPQVINFARVYNPGKVLVKYKDRVFYEKNTAFADPGIFDLFNIPLIQGDPKTALRDKFSIVLTQEMAQKYFGIENPIGKILQLNNDESYSVTAVCATPPHNTSINYDFLLSFSTFQELGGEEFMQNWITTFLTTYVLLAENVSPEYVEQKINEVLNNHSIAEVERSLHLEQFSRIHLYSEITGAGDIKYIYIFLTIGILILLIACINFMNLSTARSINRAKEVGLRKVVGANRVQLIRQFFGESIFTALMSLALAIIVVANLLPLFENLTRQDLQLPGFSQWNFYLLLLAITIVAGLVAGSYPAMILSSFRPVTVLKSSEGIHDRRSLFRKVLVLVQFSIAIILFICTLIISEQLDFLRKKDLGFQKEQIVVVPVQRMSYEQRIEPFKTTLSRQTSILGVTCSMLLPSSIGYYNNITWEGANEGESISIIQNKVDYEFLDTYEIRLLQGRNFSKEFTSDILDYNNEQAGAALINEEAVRRFGWSDPVGKKLIQTFGQMRSYFIVVGIFEDFHFTSLRNKIQPLYLMLHFNSTQYVSIKIVPDNIEQTIAFIEQSWKEINPEYPFEYYFLDKSFDRYYRSETSLKTLFNYFSLLAIFISCLGLFGMASYSAQRRTKEIGVRKVLGASVPGLVLLLGVEFIRWVVLANLIAWPLAWYVIRQWLQNFAYRIDISWSNFVISGMLALIIALVTVSWQAIRAATINPAATLRYE